MLKEKVFCSKTHLVLWVYLTAGCDIGVTQDNKLKDKVFCSKTHLKWFYRYMTLLGKTQDNKLKGKQKCSAARPT